MVTVKQNTVKDIIKAVLIKIKKIVKKDQRMLGGENIIVEMDESMFSKKNTIEEEKKILSG